MDAPDPSRLPIPDWLNLGCPKCGYPLRGLPEHRCPECGLAFDLNTLLTPLVPFHPPDITPTTRPVPELGLACPACDDFLDGATGNQCPHCGARFDVQDFIPKGAWICVTGTESEFHRSFLCTRLANAGIPFLEVRQSLQAMLGLGLASFGGSEVLVPREYYLDALLVMSEPTDRGLSPWTCAACGEVVPGNFDVCWSCGAEAVKDQAPSPEPAD
ncbi:MAG: hypothetical protein JXA69_20015 [Phycisphaerae bacterium]|nr:hypothetical protein [Phycisphaerae bacterium]